MDKMEDKKEQTQEEEETKQDPNQLLNQYIEEETKKEDKEGEKDKSSQNQNEKKKFPTAVIIWAIIIGVSFMIITYVGFNIFLKKPTPNRQITQDTTQQTTQYTHTQYAVNNYTQQQNSYTQYSSENSLASTSSSTSQKKNFNHNTNVVVKGLIGEIKKEVKNELNDLENEINLLKVKFNSLENQIEEIKKEIETLKVEKVNREIVNSLASKIKAIENKLNSITQSIELLKESGGNDIANVGNVNILGTIKVDAITDLYITLKGVNYWVGDSLTLSLNNGEKKKMKIIKIDASKGMIYLEDIWGNNYSLRVLVSE